MRSVSRGDDCVSEAEPTGKAATQERILAAATPLFVEQGYDRTTMQQVADEAGVSRATVFWHFSEKAAVFRECFSRVLRPFFDSLERDLSDVPPTKRLEARLAASEQFARERRTEVTAFVSWAVASEDFREHVINVLLDLNQRFSQAIAEAIEELDPAGHDAKRLALGIVLAFDANLILSLFDGSERRASERAAAVSALTNVVERLAARR